MSGVDTDLLAMLESLGDNCELGFVLREHQFETGSLLRWALCPIETVTAYINRTESRAAFEFEQLESSSPGMVVDISTGFRFHSAMRSKPVGDGFEFELDAASRREIYGNEKAKHDHLLEKFETSINTDAKRVFVVKANDDLSQESIEQLHQAIAARKSTQNFVLLVVFQNKLQTHQPINWINDSLAYAYVDRFAPYLSAFDVDMASWNRVLMELTQSPIIATWLGKYSMPVTTFNNFLKSTAAEKITSAMINVTLPESTVHTAKGIDVALKVDTQATQIELAYVLPSLDENSYYHSMVELLPALYAYKVLELDCPILAPQELSPVECSIASMIGVDVNLITVCDPSQRAIASAIEPQVDGLASLFFEGLRHVTRSQNQSHKKLYIARSSSAVSVFTNEDEVQQRVKEMGFDVVSFDGLTLSERMSIVSDAAVIVATHGPELTNMVFSDAGARIIEVMPNEHARPLFKTLSDHCGHHYSAVVGEAVNEPAHDAGASSWWFNPEELARLIA